MASHCPVRMKLVRWKQKAPVLRHAAYSQRALTDKDYILQERSVSTSATFGVWVHNSG